MMTRGDHEPHAAIHVEAASLPAKNRSLLLCRTTLRRAAASLYSFIATVCCFTAILLQYNIIMYCGDETGAFIGDIGSHGSRFGYGGEDNPKHVVPSYTLQDGAIPSSPLEFRGDVTPIYRMAASSNKKPLVNPYAYLQQGDLVENWDAYENVWKASFDVLHVNDGYKHTTGATATAAAGGTTSETVQSKYAGDGSCPHPLLAVDSGMTCIMDAPSITNQHLKMTELFMESLNASSLFIAPAPMLAAFSHGRQTCMVVDIGAAGCRVTPVVDGLLLKHAQRRNGRGGDWLGNVTWQALLNQDVTPKPRFLLRNSKAKPQVPFYRWAMQESMYEFRSMDHTTLTKWRMDTSTPFVYKEDARCPNGGIFHGTMYISTSRWNTGGSHDSYWKRFNALARIALFRHCALFGLD